LNKDEQERSLRVSVNREKKEVNVLTYGFARPGYYFKIESFYNSEGFMFSDNSTRDQSVFD
jgi:hypothetical protein